MLTSEQYLGAVAERAQRSGARLNSVRIGPVVAVVGLLTESVVVSTTNYCVVAAAVPEVSAAALHHFTGQATQHARANVLGTVGWTAASVVIAGLVGQRVYPDAAQAATAKPVNQFGSETRMVAVDLSAGITYAWAGSKMWGAAVQSSINAKQTFCFPQPAEVYQQVLWQQMQQAQQQQQQAPPGWQPQQQALPQLPPYLPPPVPPAHPPQPGPYGY